MAKRARPALAFNFAGLPDHHAYFAQALGFAFQDWGVSAAFHDAAAEWHAIHHEQSLSLFEYSHGHGLERASYNGRCLQRCQDEVMLVRGEHAGFCDFFVPIVREGKVDAVLIVGMVAKARPLAEEVLARWRWLTGRRGHPADAEFAKYLSMTLEAFTLDSEKIIHFERWLECFAALMAGTGNARALSTEASLLKLKLDEARFAERTWECVREMVDESRRRLWHSPQMVDDLLRIGIERPPEHALVGLLTRLDSESDPVKDLLDRNAFQRACVGLARDKGLLAGRVGEQGVVFLIATRASGARLERSLREFGRSASSLARRFGYSLHLGSSSSASGTHLGERYEHALASAERALVHRQSWSDVEDGAQPLSAVRELRRSLRSLSQEQPQALVSRFERYLQAVATSSGYRVDVARAELDAGFDQAALALLEAGVLAETNYRESCHNLDRSARSVTSVAELFAAYRRAVSELVSIAQRPVESAQHLGLRRAIAFINQHLGEPLSLSRVARVGGFAPSYFSALFKRREGTTFENYVRQLRIEHAKELLAGTELPIARVAELSGFRLTHYFYRVFKEAMKTTPLAYRRSRVGSRRQPAIARPDRARERRRSSS